MLKEITPEYSLEGLMLKLKLQYFGHLMWTDDSLEKTLMLGKVEGRRRREHQRMIWLDGITDTGTWFGQAPGDGEGQGALACCSSWGHTELDTTGQLSNKNYQYAQNLSQCLLHDKCLINTTWVLHERNLKHQWGMVGKYLSEQNKIKIKTLNCFTLSITNRNIGIFEFSDPKLSSVHKWIV